MKTLLILVCLMINAVGFCQDWNTDFDTAKKQATAANKNILLVFSGPEWCENCTKLDELVWASPEFRAEAEKSWVLLRADFHQKKGMPEPFDVNDIKVILAEKFNRDGFFPFIVLLDKYGRKLNKVGYENLDTAQEYVSMFRRLSNN